MKKKVNRVKYKKKEKETKTKNLQKKKKKEIKTQIKKHSWTQMHLGTMAGGSAHFFSSSSFLKSNSSLKNSLLTERIKKAQ